MSKDKLGDRMKEYENTFRFYLPKRTPLILRLDMKCGHSFTRGFERPFDKIFMTCIQKTALELCKNIEGSRISYQQSDEISLFLTDYDNIETQAWFDKNLQKMCSIAASMATLAFNRAFEEEVEALNFDWTMGVEGIDSNYLSALYKAQEKGAMFDARCFVLPKEEVCNYFQWRQNDCTRNSIQMVGQANFSHKQLQNKSCDNIQEMLWQEKNINWNDFSTVEKRGSCCVKDGVKTVIDKQTGEEKERKTWRVDTEIPIFSQDRNYIERFV